jgi:Na+/phosphate symporter
MKDIFNFISKVIFIVLFVEFIKAVWNGGLIGKLILLSLVAIGIYQTYFNQPEMIHLTR